MRLKISFIAWILALSATSFAQGKLTTFILLRHAEKVSDGSKNPVLTEAGKKRADGLVTLFRNTPIAAIYTTDYIRTRETVAPLAKSKSLEMKNYEAFKDDAIAKMLKDHDGGTVLVSGHSNNIPRIANYLTGTENYKDFNDGDYGNILIVTVAERGRVANVTWLTY